MKYHIIAFLMGYLLDLIIGDPVNIPHPIRLIGNVISKLDHWFMDPFMKRQRDSKKEKRAGVCLVLILVIGTGVISGCLLFLCYRIHFLLGIAAEAVLTCYILAAKSLETESMKVAERLTNGTLEEARYAVSMIVGRDTKVLDEEGVTKAAVETVAENTSDGVIAPMFYAAIGGPVLGLMYKAVNTMDSMVGYHNERYEDFGSAAAGLDDVVNFLPARLSGWLMILAAGICRTIFRDEHYDMKGAALIYKRDRNLTKSPNAGQTESVTAGALGIRLAGDACYFGTVVKKPYLGDPLRKIETADIKRTCRLMYMTEALMVLLASMVFVILMVL